MTNYDYWINNPNWGEGVEKFPWPPLKEESYSQDEFYQLTQDEVELYHAKNRDYTHGGDPNGNFNRVSKILGLYPGLKLSEPEVVCITYMLKQLDAALWMMSQGYEGNTEDVDTRLRDVHVYAKICRILHKEG